MQMEKNQIKILLSYHRHDIEWRDSFDKQVVPLQKKGQLDISYNEVTTSSPAFINKKGLSSFDVVILCISKKYISLKNLTQESVHKKILVMQDRGTRIIPVFLESCPWQSVSWLREMRLWPSHQLSFSNMSEEEKEKYISKLIKEELKLPGTEEAKRAYGEDKFGEGAYGEHENVIREESDTGTEPRGVVEFEKAVVCKLGIASREVIKTAIELSSGVGSGPPVVTTSWLVFALAVTGKREKKGENTSTFFYKRVKEKEESVKKAYFQAVQKRLQSKRAKLGKGIGLTTYISPLMKRIKKIAVETTGEETIHLRHLFAGLLVYTRKGRDTGAHRRLKEMGVDIVEVCGEFLRFLERSGIGDDITAWTRILTGKTELEEIDEEGMLKATIAAYGIADQAVAVDSLGFEPYTTAVANFLGHKNTKPPLTMSIEGEWGSGKTSFMKQLMDKLRSKDSCFVWFSPWRHDKEEAVCAAFVLAFIESRRKELRWIRATQANLKLQLDRFDFEAAWPEIIRIALKLFAYVFVVVCILVMVWAVPYIKNINPIGKWLMSITSVFVGVGTVILKALGKAQELVGNPFEHDLKKYIQVPDYAGRIPFVERFHKDFDKIVKAYAKDKRVYVFIDDLDRCEIPRAADLMKAINLMISDNQESKLVFIIGMDRQKVAAGLAVKDERLIPYLRPELGSKADDIVLQTNELEGLRYGIAFIEKFIQLPFSIPRPTQPDIEEMMDSIAKEASQEEKQVVALGVKKSLNNSDEQNVESVDGEQGETPESGISGGDINEDMLMEQENKEAKKRQLELKIANDSLEVREIVSMVSLALDHNPRRIKQFINIFRLRAYIAHETGLLIPPEEVNEVAERITLEQLGKIIAISLRWPFVLASLEQDKGLLKGLSAYAESDRENINLLKGDVAKRWAQDKVLMDLMSFGCVKDGERSSKWSSCTLTHAKVDKILQVSPKVRNIELVPLEISVSSAVAVSDAVGAEVVNSEQQKIRKETEGASEHEGSREIKSSKKKEAPAKTITKKKAKKKTVKQKATKKKLK